jgi:hypothetical protein
MDDAFTRTVRRYGTYLCQAERKDLMAWIVSIMFRTTGESDVTNSQNTHYHSTTVLVSQYYNASSHFPVGLAVLPSRSRYNYISTCL